MPDLQVLRRSPVESFCHESMRPPGEYGSNHYDGISRFPGGRYFCIFSFFPLAISTRVVYNYLHMAG